MSWDATLTDDRGHTEIDVNYTHNTNRMIAAAILASEGTETPLCGGPLGKAIGPAWWDRLDGMTGEDSRAFLSMIVTELRGDPDKYRAMNPDNGWGDYDTLCGLLDSMREAVPEWPTSWRVRG